MLMMHNLEYMPLIRQGLGIYLGINETETICLLIGRNVLVYGGSLRDIISCQPINDVDIVVSDKDLFMVTYKLGSFGFVKKDGQTMGGESEEYQNLSNLFHVQEWNKEFPSGSSAKVHLMTLKKGFTDMVNNMPWMGCSQEMWDEYMLLKFAASVDMTCCGLAYNENIGLIETIEGALSDCQDFRTTYLKGNFMEVNKEKRIKKMKDRGWNVIEDKLKMTFPTPYSGASGVAGTSGVSGGMTT